MQEISNQKSLPTNPHFLFLILFSVQAWFYRSWMLASISVLILTMLPAVISLVFIFKPSKQNTFKTAILLTLVSFGGCASLLITVLNGTSDKVEWGVWLYLAAMLIMIWETMSSWSRIDTSYRPAMRIIVNLFVPFIFGVVLVYLWEMFTVGFNVPQVLLPSPHLIALALAKSTAMLWADFQQTFLKAVLSGYMMGCGSGFVVAILVNRVPFLQRGLLPLGNLVSALPIVGIAPIMVMWFGFDWQSKAAVVVIMTFFPMLVNTITGLATSGQIERDLMHSYAADYWQSLLKLHIPNALPFIFNALKINSTLALIGAIVAEFFGTPIVGMGFRISTEVGRMNVDVVWATIVVAALSGSLFYALVALCERRMTAWHPSLRKR